MIYVNALIARVLFTVQEDIGNVQLAGISSIPDMPTAVMQISFTETILVYTEINTSQKYSNPVSEESQDQYLLLQGM